MMSVLQKRCSRYPWQALPREGIFRAEGLYFGNYCAPVWPSAMPSPAKPFTPGGRPGDAKALLLPVSPCTLRFADSGDATGSTTSSASGMDDTVCRKSSIASTAARNAHCSQERTSSPSSTMSCLSTSDSWCGIKT